MNDQFLYDHCPPVRQAFAESLYRQLENRSIVGQLPQKGFHFMVRRNFGMGLLVLLLVSFGIIYSSSGIVQAEVDRIIRNIAGFFVEERTESPVDESIQILPVTIDQVPTMEIQPTFTPFSVEIPVLAASDVIQNPPFDFVLPTYVPQGFELSTDAAVAISKEWVMVDWEDGKQTEIEMLVERSYSGYNLQVGVESVEEINVNGQPALLVRGGWNGNRVWQADYGMEVHWQTDGRYYRLIWRQHITEGNEVTAITGDLESIKNELIRMAESVK